MDEELEDLQLFKLEVCESLDELETGLLSLEKNGILDETIDSVFRAAHTIKGGARLMGFETIENLSHKMENALDKIRSREMRLSSELVSILLKITDFIKSAAEQTHTTALNDSQDFEQLIDQLEHYNEQEISSNSDIDKEIDNEKKITTNHYLKNDNLHNIKIEVDSLDKIMRLVGELVLCRNQMVQVSQEKKSIELQNTVSKFSSVTSELQQRVMNTRMQPVATLFSRYDRIVEDLSYKLNKKASLYIGTEKAELDRKMLEALKDPISHLINNAMDHGLELPEERKRKNKDIEGKIHLNSYHEGGQVIIEVKDDGAGFDVEKIKTKLIKKKLIPQDMLALMNEEDVLQKVFVPGFSTLDEATLVSGRGVGLDVVKSNIATIGGQVTVQSKKDQGTTFKIHIPLTLSVMPAITVTVNQRTYVIPQNNLQEIIRLDRNELKNIEAHNGIETYRLRRNLLPLVRFSKLIDSPCTTDLSTSYIMVILCGEQPLGLIVEDINDVEEIVVKPLSTHLKELDIFMGSTLLGNGEIALILDIFGIGNHINITTKDKAINTKRNVHRARTANSALLFNLGCSDTFAVQMSQVRRLEEIRTSSIEKTQGREVIQYRGGILPLINLHESIDVDFDDSASELQNLIIIEFKGREVALKVKHIIDSIDFEGDLNTHMIDDPCILGTMDHCGNPYLLVDSYRVFEKAFKSHDESYTSEMKSKVLYVDDSSFFLKVVARYLNEEGYECETEIQSPKAINSLKKERYDLLIVDLEMPEMDGFQLIEKVKEDISLQELPIIVLSSVISEKDRNLAIELGANECLVKLSREDLVQKVNAYLSHSCTT